MKMSNKGPGFYITGKKGFHFVCENNWTISVQFGPGNYCANYARSIGKDDEACGKDGSPTAECAVWGPDGEMVEYKGWGDSISNRSTPKQVLELLNWAASQ